MATTSKRGSRKTKSSTVEEEKPNQVAETSANNKPAIQQTPMSSGLLEKLVVNQDLSDLSPEQKVEYYIQLCNRLQLDPASKPFEFIEMNNKLVVYALKSCTEQLRQRDKVSLTITARENTGGIYIVVVRATTPDGRCDEATGATALMTVKGDPKSPEETANAIMRAETKAKRRVTLSICGLGMLDESEMVDIATSETDRQANELARQREAMAASAAAHPIGTPVNAVSSVPEVKPSTGPSPAAAPEKPKEGAPEPAKTPEPPAPVERAVLQKDDLGEYVIKTVQTANYMGKKLSDLDDNLLGALYHSWANKPEYIEKFKDPKLADKGAEAEVVRKYAKARLNIKE